MPSCRNKCGTRIPFPPWFRISRRVAQLTQPICPFPERSWLLIARSSSAPNWLSAAASVSIRASPLACIAPKSLKICERCAISIGGGGVGEEVHRLDGTSSYHRLSDPALSSQANPDARLPLFFFFFATARVLLRRRL